MYFIGSGALLSHAIAHAVHAGLRVDGACVPPADGACARLKHLGIKVLECAAPNAAADAIVQAAADGIVWSINNQHLLDNTLLAAGPKFFNIHNGWVQRYRGIAEICIFAALSRGEDEYGVSLQQLLPGQRVDAGPVVAQTRFAIALDAGFGEVLDSSLAACRALFEAQVARIAAGDYSSVAVDTAAAALRYQDLPALASAATPANLARARRLGRYAGLLPRLQAALAPL